MTRAQPRHLRLLSGIAGAVILAGCGAVPFLDEEAGITGTDEDALRAAAQDAIVAFLDSDWARAAKYIDPTCGVSEDRVEVVIDEFETFLKDVADVGLDEVFGSIQVVDVSVDGLVGIVTQVSDPIPGYEDTETESTDIEWHVVEGRWVLPSCSDYLTSEEAEEFGYPTNVRFDADGSVIVLSAPEARDTEPDQDASQSATDDFDSDDDAQSASVLPVLETIAPPATSVPAPPSTLAPAPPATPAPAPTKLDPTFIIGSVSSELPPFQNLSYGAANLFDGILQTAWNHCGDCTGDSGVGQRITIGFTQPVTVVGIRIANGYQKDANDVFSRNHRAAQLTATTFEASASEILTLQDAKGYQLFSFPKTTTSGLFIDVDATYPGSDYPDLAVSEIEVFVLSSP